MATVTPNYNWPVPLSTDLVKDGADAIKDLGDAIDATVFGLPSGALTLVSATTIGTAVASVTVTGAFSADYDNYKIIIAGGVGSTTDAQLTFQLGASTTGYYAGISGGLFGSASAFLVATANGSNWARTAHASTTGCATSIELTSPFLAKRTTISSDYVIFKTDGAGAKQIGYHNVETSYANFTIAASTGTLTGGEIRVYGYQN